jgi:hypothetical protein
MEPLPDPYAIPGEPGACEGCGRALLAVKFSSSSPTLCAYCAEYENRKHTDRSQTGADPPPEAYQDVKLAENWKPL